MSLRPWEIFRVLAGEDSTVWAVELARNAFHLQTRKGNFRIRKDGVSCYQRLKQYSHQVAVKHLRVKALTCNGYFFLVEKKKLRFPDSNAVTAKNWKFTFLGLVLLMQVVVQLGKALAVVSTHAEGMEGVEYAAFENNLLLWLDHQSKDHDQNHLS